MKTRVTATFVDGMLKLDQEVELPNHDSLRKRSLEAVRVLAQLGPVRAAYVFGSQIDGTADEWSDIDIAAFMDDVERWDIRQRAQAMTLVQRQVGSDMELHLFPADSFRTPPRASFAQYILQHGARLDIEGIATKTE